MSMMKIGFIGLGNMGSTVARNLQRADFDLSVYDIRREATELLRQVNGVMTMVFGPKEVEQVVRGKDGLLAGPCQQKLGLDMTTSSPSLMRQLAADAPVTGSVDSAIRGGMILFVGGSDTAVSQALPVLNAVGKVRRVGQYGNGYIDELIQETGTRSEFTQATYARFREAAARYGENAGEMTVCKLIEEDAGVDLRVAGEWIAPWQVKHPDEKS